MSASARRAGILVVLVFVALAASCGGSRFGDQQEGLAGDQVADTLPGRPGLGGTTVARVPRSAPSTTAKGSASTTTSKPPKATPKPSITTTTTTRRPKVTTPPTTAKVLSPELQRWCPEASKALRLLAQADTLGPNDLDPALRIVLQVRDSSPSAIRPDMDVVASFSQVLVDGVKSGELSLPLPLADAAVARFIDGKAGVGTYDRTIAALGRVIDYGTKNC